MPVVNQGMPPKGRQLRDASGDRAALPETGWRRVAGRLAIGSVIAVLLIIALARLGDFSKIHMVVEPHPAFLTGFVLATALMVFLSVKKWIIVLKALNLGLVNVNGYYGFYTSLALLVGVAVPQDISSLVIRTHAAHSASDGSLSRAAFSVIADRLLDYLILAVALGPALLFIFGVLPEEVALLAFGLGLVSVILLWLKYSHGAWRCVLRVYDWLVSATRRVVFFGAESQPVNPLDIPPLRRRSALLLIAIALLRFFVVAGRVFLLVLAFDVDISFTVILLITSVAQLGLLIPLTPGGLGTAELTWLGVLTAVGVPSDEATAVLIGMRLYTVVSLALVATVSYLYYRLSRSYVRQPVAS